MGRNFVARRNGLYSVALGTAVTTAAPLTALNTTNEE
jgi:hypothetical protein